jgi:hypothetical protein
MRGTWVGVWRLDSSLTRLQPPSPACQCPGDAKGVTGFLSPERRKGGRRLRSPSPLLCACRLLGGAIEGGSHDDTPLLARRTTLERGGPPHHWLFCASALRQVGGSPRRRCCGVRSSRAMSALRAAMASWAVIGSRVDMGRSSQAVIRSSSSSCASGVLTIGTFSKAACVALGTFHLTWLTSPCAWA